MIHSSQGWEVQYQQIQHSLRNQFFIEDTIFASFCDRRANGLIKTLSHCLPPKIAPLNTINLEYTLLHKNIGVEKTCMNPQHVRYCHNCLYLPMKDCHIKCWASNVLFHILSPFSRPKDHVLFLAVIYFSIFHWFYLMWSFRLPFHICPLILL